MKLYYLSCFTLYFWFLNNITLLYLTDGDKSPVHKLRKASDEDLQNGKWKIMTYGETEVSAGQCSYSY